jgi:Gas vesicle protein
MSAELGDYATQREVSLVEILDRALGAGVVITGDITLSLADVDLVQLSLRLVLGSASTLQGDLPRDADTEPLTLTSASGDSR